MKYTPESLQDLASTPEGVQQIRVLAAECDGWKRDLLPSPLKHGNCVKKGILFCSWTHPTLRPVDNEPGYDPAHAFLTLPNYPEDLNAVQDAVMKLIQSKDQKNAFVNRLDDIATDEVEQQPDRDFAWANASAIQRCIALILTLQKP
jgi:hypothetical protein